MKLKRNFSSLLLLLFFGVLTISSAYHSNRKLQLTEISAVRIYYNHQSLDLKEETIASALCTFLNESADKIGTLDCSLDIPVTQIESLAAENPDHCYIFISFKPQTVEFNSNPGEVHENCDGFLFDTQEMVLHWSKDERLTGAMGYGNYTEERKQKFAPVMEMIQKEMKSGSGT